MPAIFSRNVGPSRRRRLPSRPLGLRLQTASACASGFAASVDGRQRGTCRELRCRSGRTYDRMQAAVLPDPCRQPRGDAMPRLRPIPRDEVSDEFTLKMYDFMFGDRDPVAEPGTVGGTTRQLVDGDGAVPRRPAPCRAWLPPLPRRGLHPGRSPRVGPDPGGLGGRQPVRLLATLQGVPVGGTVRGEDRGHPVAGRPPTVSITPSGYCWPTRIALRANMVGYPSSCSLSYGKSSPTPRSSNSLTPPPCT